jgi:hypothetical protein
MLSSEWNAGRSFSKCFEWSRQLKQTVQACRYWKLRLQQKRGGIISTSRIEYYRNSALLPLDVSTEETRNQIIAALKASSQALKDHQKLHKNL